MDSIDHRIAVRIVPVLFFTAPATTEIYTLSLHDALPICEGHHPAHRHVHVVRVARPRPHLHRLGLHPPADRVGEGVRSEEHTSELQSRFDLVCRLLLEKKKNKKTLNLYLRHKSSRVHP